MKLHLLDLGRLDYDEGFPLAGAGVSTASDPNPDSSRRTVGIIAALVEHPRVGPVLFDTGAVAAYSELWPPVVQELFAISRYEDEHRLDRALQAAGYLTGTQSTATTESCSTAFICTVSPVTPPGYSACGSTLPTLARSS